MELDAVIWFKETDEKMGCVVHDITPDCTEASVVISNMRPCAGGKVELDIFLPTERTPIKCNGEVIQHPAGEDDSSGNSSGSLVHLLLIHTSRIDHRRLELFVTQRRAFISGGHRT